MRRADRIARGFGWLVAAVLAIQLFLTIGPCRTTSKLGDETTIVDGRRVFVMEESACNDTPNASCAAAVAVDGRDFVIRCDRAPTSDGQLVAVSSVLMIREARQLPGVAPADRLAGLSTAAGPCGGWVLLVNAG